MIRMKGTTPENNAPEDEALGAACNKGIKDIFIPSIFEFLVIKLVLQFYH